jgi:uncharacterized glyoxalase superfamily protein PhnB
MQELTTTRQTIFHGVRYSDARAAIAWLERAFGAEQLVCYDMPDGTVAHAELRIAGNLIMLGETRDDEHPVRTPEQSGGVTASFYVVLPDAATVDAMHARAVAAGAKILHDPYDTDYGSHDFAAYDCGGHPWTFGTYDPAATHAP